MSAKIEPRGIHVDQSELMCRDNCGYYGNPAWQGYCSKCWRAQNRRRQQEQQHDEQLNKGMESEAPTSSLFAEATSMFTKMRRTKRRRKRSKLINLTQFIWKTAPRQEIQELPTMSPQTPTQVQSGDFTEFLKSLQKPSVQIIQKRCHRFIEDLQARPNLDVQLQSDLVQDFYQNIAVHFNGFSTEQRDRMIDYIEKVIMTRLYKTVFCPDSSEDEHKDLVMQQRIRALHWVTAEMLQVPIDENKPEAMEHLESSIAAIVKMDTKRAPQDKLACIARCSGHIFSAIQISSEEPAVTDDFLSSLIHVVLKVNPPRLHSNIQYIIRFCHPKRLMTGEVGYYFTNLCCAVAFIEKMNGPSLNLSHEEFEEYMEGHKVPIRKFPSFLLHSASPGIQQMHKNLQLLSELQERQDRIISEVKKLEKEFWEWTLSVKEEVEEAIRKFPL
uniref:rab5 GDP/GTP exchange factor-like n=1 Tax=Pristiophorus japonicus TaxID=55135 RepID=UPI00398E4AEB